MKKYELTKECKTLTDGTKLFRIKALKNFGNTREGELGGWVQSEKNLSQEGLCWVSDNAQVYGNTWISGNARVYDNALVSGDARVAGNAWVTDNVKVSDSAQVSGDARVYGNAKVSGEVRVYGNAMVSGNALVSGDAQVAGNARVAGRAYITKLEDIQIFQGVGSQNGTLTAYRTDTEVELRRGCFAGNINRFRQDVKETHKNNPKILKSYLGIANIIAHWFDEEIEA